MCNGMSSKECIFTGKKVLPNLNVQWNVFKGVYFYWKKSTPQFKIELISGDYFFPCGSKFFPGKYYSGSTFFPGNYYFGSNYLRLHRFLYEGNTLAFNGFNDELPHSFKFRIFLNSFSMSLSMCFTSISLMG